MSNHVIQGLWFGESLTNLERLCMKSFMDNGHEFHLYVYDELQDIPQGVIVKDANEIVPRTRIKEFRWFAGFSDFFRYMLLAKKGGWYVDMDVICLRPLDFLLSMYLPRTVARIIRLAMRHLFRPICTGISPTNLWVTES